MVKNGEKAIVGCMMGDVPLCFGALGMVSAKLLSSLRELDRADKLYIVQVLISELAQKETTIIQPGQSYPVWSPNDAVEAADTMLKVLEATKNQERA